MTVIREPLRAGELIQLEGAFYCFTMCASRFRSKCAAVSDRHRAGAGQILLDPRAS
ncbi:MAG: hypothetical protein ACLSA6_06365 [Holdemania massiliensis]